MSVQKKKNKTKKVNLSLFAYTSYIVYYIVIIIFNVWM